MKKTSIKHLTDDQLDKTIQKNKKTHKITRKINIGLWIIAVLTGIANVGAAFLNSVIGAAIVLSLDCLLIGAFATNALVKFKSSQACANCESEKAERQAASEKSNAEVSEMQTSIKKVKESDSTWQIESGESDIITTTYKVKSTPSAKPEGEPLQPGNN